MTTYLLISSDFLPYDFEQAYLYHIELNNMHIRDHWDEVLLMGAHWCG